MTRGRTTNSRGFTLVELMVVVVLVGVLAVLGLVILGRHQKASRTYETLAMVQSIRIAQERWRAENLTYLNVSAQNPDDPTGQGGVWFPRPVVGSGAQGSRRMNFLQAASSHPQGEAWIMLNPTSNPLVYGGYKTNAGMSHQAMTTPEFPVTGGFSWGTPTESWYVIQAVMDTDEDGNVSYYLASSLNGEVYRQNEGE